MSNDELNLSYTTKSRETLKKILKMSVFGVLLIGVIAGAFYGFVYIKTKNDYISTYNACLSQISETYLLDESIRNECGEQGGCLIACGGCGTPRSPNARLSDVIEALYPKSCIAECRPICLLPP